MKNILRRISADKKESRLPNPLNHADNKYLYYICPKTIEMTTNILYEDAEHAALYAKFRPKVPQSLISKLVQSLTVPKTLAIDVGCGNGQATFALTPYFEKVIGIDISHNQIEEALKRVDKEKHGNVIFRQGGETNLMAEDQSVSLVTACSAVHWFDIEKFYNEVNRVLMPGGILALFGTNYTQAGHKMENFEKLNQLLDKFLIDISSYRHESVQMSLDEYKTLPKIPFSEVERDDSHCTEFEASLSDYLGYMQSINTFQRFQNDRGRKAAQELIANFEKNYREILKADPNIKSEDIKLQCSSPYFMVFAKK